MILLKYEGWCFTDSVFSIYEMGGYDPWAEEIGEAALPIPPSRRHWIPRRTHSDDQDPEMAQIGRETRRRRAQAPPPAGGATLAAPPCRWPSLKARSARAGRAAPERGARLPEALGGQTPK